MLAHAAEKWLRPQKDSQRAEKIQPEPMHISVTAFDLFVNAVLKEFGRACSASGSG